MTGAVDIDFLVEDSPALSSFQKAYAGLCSSEEVGMVFIIMERLGICYSFRTSSRIEYRFPSLLRENLLTPLPTLSGSCYGARLQWKYLTNDFQLPIPRTLFAKVQATLASSTHFGYPGRSDRMKAARDSVRISSLEKTSSLSNGRIPLYCSLLTAPRTLAL